MVFLQPSCDMTCLFCATEEGFRALDPARGETLIRSLHRQGVSNLILGGGEPFAWKHGPLGLARFAKELGLTVQIGTNGIALPGGFENSPWVDRYILPLESAEAAVHDRLRIHPGGHHRIVLDRLAALRQSRKGVTVSTVVTRRNLDGLPALAQYLAGYQRGNGNLHAWHLYKLLPVGRGGSRHGPALDVPAEAYHAACALARREAPELRILKRPDMLHSSTVGFFWLDQDGFRSQSPYPIVLPR